MQPLPIMMASSMGELLALCPAVLDMGGKIILVICMKNAVNQGLYLCAGRRYGTGNRAESHRNYDRQRSCT